MPSTGLNGPTVLSDANISMVITRKSPGAYALGYVDTAGAFNVSYVGRSDDDIAGRLKQHVGKYRHFKFGLYSSASAAYEKECALYHDFSPPDNSIHPDAPNGLNLRCVVCRR